MSAVAPSLRAMRRPLTFLLICALAIALAGCENVSTSNRASDWLSGQVSRQVAVVAGLFVASRLKPR